MNYSTNILITNEDEKNMCTILDKGLSEFKGSNNNNNNLSQNINPITSSSNNNLNLTYQLNSNVLQSVYSNNINNNEDISFEQINVTNVKKSKSTARQKFKEMEKKLDELQTKIYSLDKRLLGNNSSSKLRTLKKKSKSISKIKKNSSLSRTKSKKRINSVKVEDRQKYNADDNDIWKERYVKLKNEFTEDKNELIKLRKTSNDLQKKLKSLAKKEAMYDELFTENQTLLDKNEKLYSQLEESEEIRIEQEKLIKSLQKEVNRLRGSFESKSTKKSRK